MEFRTTVIPDISNNKIDYSSKSLLIGSCFVENIGQKLVKSGFDAMINPFGIQYNPASIANVFDRVIDLKEIETSELFFYNELYHHYDFHGDFSNPNNQIALQQMNKSLRNAHIYLKQCDFLFITFGTSFIFSQKSTGKIVGNCHKILASEFDRKILHISQMIDLWEDLIIKIRNINPTIQIVFTVSPIRHLRDGAEMNQVSKSQLILLCYHLKQSFDNINYFASYEIMMDDLRDYRFYAPDMAHVNQTAIDYIFEKFILSYIYEKSYAIMKKINNLQKDIEHKPINIKSDAYLIFLKKRLQIIDDLSIEIDSTELKRLKEKFSIIIENIGQMK